MHGPTCTFWANLTPFPLKGEHSWAFVNFQTKAEAAAAAAGGVTSVGGADVEVAARTPAKARDDTAIPASVNIYLNGLDEQTTEEDVIGALAAFGAVPSRDANSGGAGPPWPRDPTASYISYPVGRSYVPKELRSSYPFPIELAWDLIEVPCLRPPWLSGSYHPRLCLMILSSLIMWRVVWRLV